MAPDPTPRQGAELPVASPGPGTGAGRRRIASRRLVGIASVVGLVVALWILALGGGEEQRPSGDLGRSAPDVRPDPDPPVAVLEGRSAPEGAEEAPGTRQASSAPEDELSPAAEPPPELAEGHSYRILGDLVDSRGRPVVEYDARFANQGLRTRSSRLWLRGRSERVRSDSVLTVRTELEVARIEGLGEQILAGERRIDLGEVRLAPPVGNVWTGRVVWSDGRPVAGARVALGLTDEEREPYAAPRFRKATDDGEFALEHERDVPRTLLVEDPVSRLSGRFGPFEVGPRAEPLVLPVDQASVPLDCLVVDDRGNPLANQWVWIEPGLWDGGLRRDHATTTDDGRLVHGGLAATSHLTIPDNDVTLRRSLTVAEAHEAGWIEVPTGRQVLLWSDDSRPQAVKLDALDEHGNVLQRIHRTVGHQSIVVWSRTDPSPRVLVPRGTHTLVVLEDLMGSPSDRELSRHPLPGKPGELEWLVLPSYH